MNTIISNDARLAVRDDPAVVTQPGVNSSAFSARPLGTAVEGSDRLCRQERGDPVRRGLKPDAMWRTVRPTLTLDVTMTGTGRETASSPPGAAGPRPISTLACPSCGASNRIAPSERGAPHCGKCGKPLPWLVNADEMTFEVEAKAAPTVVVDLWAPWCGPCRVVGPMLEELAREHAGRLKVIKVNVDDNQNLARRFEAMSIPMMLVLRDGQIVNRIVGAMPKSHLAAQITPHIKPPKS